MRLRALLNQLLQAEVTLGSDTDVIFNSDGFNAFDFYLYAEQDSGRWVLHLHPRGAHTDIPATAQFLPLPAGPSPSAA